ncbi:hypothetical protein BJ912DRAFT_975749 [Pholiota molesta]|nr:hypothetical protein BJ912DRAFT_975749 [Pholiota molesta]
MGPPASVIQWVNNHFPKPRVDLEWLDGCCEWLIDDQNLSPVTAFPQFVERVKEQLLESDLADSMSKGTGFNPNITQATEDLQGPPILVQIVAMTEIGTSAFQLEQTRVAREERMRTGLGNVEGEEDGDVEVEGEGPMPKYPRGTLRFQLSDGETIIDAMEFRNLPQLSLGVTELGYKMQLQGTRIQNGMAFLEPATVNMLGGRQADLEARQLNDFKQGLRARLGRPLSPEPEHDDDIEMEPRRRLPAASSLNNHPIASTSTNAPQTRPIIALPSRHTRTSLASNINDETEMEIVTNNTSTLGSAELHKITASKSAYFDASAGSNSRTASSSKQANDLDFTFAVTSQTQHAGAKDASFDFDFLDELDDENLPPRVDKGKAPEHDYGMDDIDFGDADFWDNVDKVIEKAVADGDAPMAPVHHPPSSASASASGSGVSSSYVRLDKKMTAGKSDRSSAPAPTQALDVIEINDSDEDMYEAEDKENQPVPTRRVRQRMDVNREGPALSQRTGRPVILAKSPEDVIDLSDSD